MTLVVKSDNEINSIKAKLSHSKKHNNKSKLAASTTSTKNLVNIQPKPSPPFLLPCQPPFIYPSSNSAAVVAQQQLFSLQLLMSSPYFAQALAALNANNSNANATTPNTTTTNKNNTNVASASTTTTTNASVNTTTKTNNTGASSSISTPPVSLPAVAPTSATTNKSSNSKIATSAPNSLPPNTLPFLPPNISLPYFAAAMTSLANANQQILNGNAAKTNSTNASNLSTSAPSPNSKNIKVSPKGAKTNPIPSVNPSLFPKTDNAAANGK
ncbi:hypothetical protein PIROE2DRAFT_10681 [Piromyces sp. E2]|nr:hypothetical protein PIROE2DRAFT_10681 [Piromyces sp. E2]|eukprot:OUM62933.1 hypothetical protein PIROE2DRAFT_10681 [Piromyces sp. E2]